jgi:D-amino-acid dehydrogenase
MAEKFDVLVLGAGIVGVSCALHLQRRGRRAALIDRKGPGEETSYGNSGVIESSSVLPYAFPKLADLARIALGMDSAARTELRHLPSILPWLLRLRRESVGERRIANGRALRPLLEQVVEEHKDLMRAADALRFLRDDGWVKLYRTTRSFEGEQKVRGYAREFGIDFAVLTPEEMTRLEPHLKPAYAHALWLKDSVTVSSPGGVTKAYAALFAREGGRILEGDAKTLYQKPGGAGWTVTTGQEICEAPEAVVALGPWSMDVLKPLGYDYPLGIKRGYHRHFKAVGNAVLTRPVVDVEKGFVIAPMEQGYRITTGAEFTEREAPPNPVQIEQVLPYARELFPLGEPAEPAAWMGRRPCFPDSLPIVDRAARHQGLWMNFGHGHLGFTLGPVTGRLLAEMMTGEKPCVEPRAYRAGRFEQAA